MSFILDALKKLERNRGQRPAPSLDELPAVLSPAPSRQWIPWTVAAVGIAAAVGAVVWRMMEPAQPKEASAPHPGEQRTVKRATIKLAAPKVVPTLAPSVHVTQPEKAGASAAPTPVQVAKASVAPLPASAPTAIQPAPKAIIPPPPAVALVPAVEPKNVVQEPRVVVPSPTEMIANRAKVEPERPARPAPHPAPTVAMRDTSKAKPAAHGEVDESTPETYPETAADNTAGSGDVELPALEQLSPELQSGIPKLKISILAYATGAADRMVYINGQKYVEGQLVDGKLKVESIVRQGVVLSVQGQRFLLRP